MGRLPHVEVRRHTSGNRYRRSRYRL